MIAYHGTNTDPEIIWSEGLKPLNYRYLADKLLLQCPKSLPKWVSKAVYRETDYQGNWHNKGPLVHLTLSKRNAASYAGAQGGEFMSNAIRFISQGLRRKVNIIKPHRYVITVDIPEPEDIKETRKRVLEHGYDWKEFMHMNTWDITVKRVLPQDIVSIEEVIGELNPRRKYG
jgi:hypothetical protein